MYPGVRIWAPWDLTIGKKTGTGSGAVLYSQGPIIIGTKVVVSQGAHLCTGTHDYTNSGFPLITKPIIIEDYVWVAAEAFIMPGVLLEKGCVIAARSVVTKNMPKWTVCAGHPCKPVKNRILCDS